jgi:hypothetical protein
VSDGAGDDDRVEAWIRTGDLDELLREVERCCERRAWPALVDLADRCRRSGATGHQLWPVASFAEYRLALEAPAEVAGPVVDAGGGYLAPGPLTEVVAQSHTWSDLDAHLRDPVVRRLVAQERVLRGEETAGATGPDDRPDDLPDRLLPWETGYPLAEYRPEGGRFPAPESPGPGRAVAGTVRTIAAECEEGTTALVDSLRHWSSRSSGSVAACGVEGSADDAIATLVAADPSPARRLGDLNRSELRPGAAAALLAWAAASGAAPGPRRGAATGRFDAWWTMAVLAGVDDDWPDGVGEAAGELRWWSWGPTTGDVGWWCRIAVEDPDDGLAWALEATDRRA